MLSLSLSLLPKMHNKKKNFKTQINYNFSVFLDLEGENFPSYYHYFLGIQTIVSNLKVK